MNIRQVEVFRAVMQTGSVAGAARLLAVSPPAISRMLRHTEDQLGYALFERRGGRLLPTPEADALYPEADAALAGVSRVSALADSLAQGQAEELRVAANPSFGATLLPHCIAEFRRRSPRAQLDIVTTAHVSVVERVALRQAELGLTQFETRHPALRQESLGRYPMCVALPEASPLARLPVVPLRDLAEMPLIGYGRDSPVGQMIDERMSALSLRRRPDITVRYPMIACMFVDAGVGAAIVDPFMALAPERWRIAFRPIEPTLETQVWLIRHGGRPLSHAGRSFARAVGLSLETLLPANK